MLTTRRGRLPLGVSLIPGSAAASAITSSSTAAVAGGRESIPAPKVTRSGESNGAWSSRCICSGESPWKSSSGRQLISCIFASAAACISSSDSSERSESTRRSASRTERAADGGLPFDDAS